MELRVSSPELLTVQVNIGDATSTGTLHHIYPGLCFILRVRELLHLEQTVRLSSTAGGISLDLGLIRDGLEVSIKGSLEYLFGAISHVPQRLGEGVK